MEKEQIKEQPLTVKVMQKHLISMITRVVVVAIVTITSTGFAFYYNTNNNITELNKTNIRQDKSINDINVTLTKINAKLGSSTTTTAVSNEKINGLTKQIDDVTENQRTMQKTQMDILRILAKIEKR